MVPKKGRFTMIRNERNELIPTRTVTGWRGVYRLQKIEYCNQERSFSFTFH